jgi:hypothetical protein
MRPRATADGGGGLPQIVPGQLLELWPACLAHWPKRSGWPARRGAAFVPGVVTAPACTPQWRDQRDLDDGLGVAAAAASAHMEQGGHTEQGGQGRSSPEQRRGVEPVEDALSGGVQRLRGSSGNE